MRTYAQLTEEQRYDIFAQRKAGCTQVEIARNPGVHPSTISRELARNRHAEEGYAPNRLTSAPCSAGRRNSRPRISDEVQDAVTGMLEVFWSPQQISGWLLPGHQHAGQP